MPFSISLRGRSSDLPVAFKSANTSCSVYPVPLAAQSCGSISFVSSATALCAVRSARHSETSPRGLELSPIWQHPPSVPHATPSTRPPQSPHSGLEERERFRRWSGMLWCNRLRPSFTRANPSCKAQLASGPWLSEGPLGKAPPHLSRVRFPQGPAGPCECAYPWAPLLCCAIKISPANGPPRQSGSQKMGCCHRGNGVARWQRPAAWFLEASRDDPGEPVKSQSSRPPSAKERPDTILALYRTSYLSPRARLFFSMRSVALQQCAKGSNFQDNARSQLTHAYTHVAAG
jgi:hypothetical protein